MLAAPRESTCPTTTVAQPCPDSSSTSARTRLAPRACRRRSTSSARLARDGVFYPQAPAGGFPDSHSNAAFLPLQGKPREFDAWLMDSWRQARAAVCDALLLSSEES